MCVSDNTFYLGHILIRHCKNKNKFYVLEVVKKTNSSFTWVKCLCAHTDSSTAQLCGTICVGMNVRVNKF